MYRQSENKLVKQQYLLYMSHNMVNLGPLAAEIVSLVWCTPGNFNGFRVLAALLHGTLVVGVSQTVALNRGRDLYSAGRPSRWALAHISSFFLFSDRLEQRDLGNYKTDLRQIFRYGKHNGVDVQSGVGFRIGQGTLL